MANRFSEELNIIITGKSGAGKSSFLNYLIEKDHFEVGEGSPVTQSYFEDFVYETPDTHVKYHLYDTKGIEPTTTSDCKKRILGEIEQRDKLGIFQWIHTVYYCFDASAKRIQPFEIAFINELKEYVSIVILLTKKDLITQKDLDELILQIEKEVDAKVQIVPVCSVNRVTRKGTSKKEGKEEVLKASFLGLWNKLSYTYPQKIIAPLFESYTLELGRGDMSIFQLFSKNDLQLLGDKIELSIFFLSNYPKWGKFNYSYEDLMALTDSTISYIEHLHHYLQNIDVNKVWSENEKIHHEIFSFYQKVNKVRPRVLYTEEAKNSFIKLANYNLEEQLFSLRQKNFEIIKNWKERADTWFFDSDETAALINSYFSFRDIVFNIGNTLNILINNYLSSYRSELLQYGQYCIRKDLKREKIEAVNSEGELDAEEKIYFTVVTSCLSDRKIQENERYMLDVLLKVLNISHQRAGLIEDFVRRCI